MGLEAQDATGCKQITALADRGYFSGDQVLACEGTGVVPIVPKTQTSGTKRGFFTRRTSSTTPSTTTTPARPARS